MMLRFTIQKMHVSEKILLWPSCVKLSEHLLVVLVEKAFQRMIKTGVEH